MAWVRVHDGAMTHPKIAGLSDKAFRLWIWGLSYAQQHLTDGVITIAAVPSRLVRATDDLVRARLWDRDADGILTVHDYLDWNDSRATVTKRQADAKERMMTNRERRSRELREAELDARSLRPPFGLVKKEDLKEEASPQTVEVSPPAITREPDVHAHLEESPPIETPLIRRASEWVDRYAALYQHHRKGARYAIKGRKDLDAAISLCRTWPEARLEQLAVIFLTTDHSFAASGSRTLTQFLALASWCDGQLAEYEAKHGAIA